MKKHYPHDTLW